MREAVLYLTGMNRASSTAPATGARTKITTADMLSAELSTSSQQAMWCENQLIATELIIPGEARFRGRATH